MHIVTFNLLAFFHFFISAAEATSVRTGATNLTALTARATGCHDYLIIDSRGTGEPQGRSSQFSGMIQKTFDGLPDGIGISNPYPASSAPNSPASGSVWLRTYLRQAVAMCPQQNYALLGWSQGAAVTWTALGGMKKDDPLHHAIKAVVVVGDPFHVPNVRGNVDQDGHGQTAGAQGKMRGGNSDATIAEWAADGKVLDICFSGDPVCNQWGDRPADHGRYGGSGEVQTLGAQFLIQHLRR
ncbi:unnamed protein product [Tilletia controversa]|uniref:Cutinase n=3 Tax=Tilletia TaxID=13289 RepID=A0A8X7MIQ7_9BASI|nr:hypothetical protein CF336_g8936 [Tilletia laevis]KAE8181972.1 hypothetical protein CF328_g8670 [Tilletia controversa]KAE8239946.1 hypothetical protein A4X03_0g8637 [Tilletia caries]KAE8182344.1 hypothetical protein CF335_g8658 [Tilletia laevis]KAE8237575.1 hypothetical protein A4X06_0g9187 [Tilletia controversa]